MLTWLVGAALLLGQESYAVDRLDPPAGVILEVGGMDWLDDGRLVVSTRRGQVWIVEHALDPDPKAARFQLFCEGLQEGLGLKVVQGEIYVLQRAELSRLRDTDGDGECDTIDTVTNDFGVSGNYHEFAFGLPLDTDGNFCVALNLGFTEPLWWHGRSLAPWRGYVLKIAPDGTVTPFANGFRSPCGIGTNAVGDLFVTDNQGDWMPACPLVHVKQGGFYGAPASLVWTDAYQASRTEPSLTNPVDVPRVPPACWIPYKWSRSTGDMRPAPKDGSFGPFADQLILAELTNGLVLRADLERVRGEYQGAVFLLRENVGSAVRTLFAPDGTLLLGLTNRGWGGLAPGHGIARVRWNKVTPFEIRHVRIRQDGFEIEFTEPLASDPVIRPEDVDITLYHYDWWWEYGSPERQDGRRAVTGSEISLDRKTLTLRAAIEAGHVARVVLKGIRSSDDRLLAHDEFNYTINQLPEGELCTTPVARVAAPPPARSTQWEGWLRLTYGDALDLWQEHAGWKLVDAELDAEDPTRLVTREGFGALVNIGPKPGPFVSSPSFGDASIHLQFMLPKDSSTTVLVQGLYGIRLCDDEYGMRVPREVCATILGRSDPDHHAPLTRPRIVPGQWHKLRFDFRAARFDATGVRTEKARFVEVRIDDVVVQENVEVEALESERKVVESEHGPLVLDGSRSQVAFGDVRVRPVRSGRRPARPEILHDDDLEGWRASAGSAWKREDGLLTNAGKSGRLVSARSDYTDFQLRARVKISAGGSADLWLRAPAAPEESGGIGVRINASHPDPARTGSISVLARKPDASLGEVHMIAPRRVGLVGEDTWFDLAVTVKSSPVEGAAVTVEVNGARVNYAGLDAEVPDHGAIAIDAGHAGSVLEIETLDLYDLSVRANDPKPPPPR
ncbi:MAG: DUF1080 domain-containing protein [Planctomycetes bacterium]|nr:DUF1080 domain-containing protein [Planctomycetota bacterium]